MATIVSAAGSGTFQIGGDLPVVRLGFGAMRITGEGVFGPPADHEESIRVLRRAVELGINLIDTSDAYGPYVSEELIAEALYPYPKDLVIATKAGLTRPGPGVWEPKGDPEYLQECLEGSLRRLKVDSIELYQLHRIDPNVPLEDQLGVFVDAQTAGKIRHIGLSEVNEQQLAEAQKIAKIATIQNRYNVADREWERMIPLCERSNIGFIPWFPLATGELARPGGKLAMIAESRGVAPSQIALAWLLQHSPTMLPIPGTSKVKHLEENTSAADIRLTPEEVEALASV